MSIYYSVKSFTNTVVGQGLDLVTPPKLKDAELFDFTNYDQEHYDEIVKWKTAFYSFCLPIQNALYLAFIDDREVHDKCRRILIDMGVYFQVQDDFLDCYGDPKVTGKVGTDIEESKCGWLIIQALKKCNAEQRSVLEVSRYDSSLFKCTMAYIIYFHKKFARISKKNCTVLV